MTILFDCGRTVKPSRVFGSGLEFVPVPPIPEAPPMPLAKPYVRPLVRWVRLDLEPLEGERVEAPEPEMTLSGAWAMPGEEHSWDFGH